MNELATEHWPKSQGNVSRVEWAHKYITEYFQQGIMEKACEKEKRKVVHLG